MTKGELISLDPAHTKFRPKKKRQRTKCLAHNRKFLNCVRKSPLGGHFPTELSLWVSVMQWAWKTSEWSNRYMNSSQVQFPQIYLNDQPFTSLLFAPALNPSVLRLCVWVEGLWVGFILTTNTTVCQARDLDLDTLGQTAGPCPFRSTISFLNTRVRCALSVRFTSLMYAQCSFLCWHLSHYSVHLQGVMSIWRMFKF